MVKKVSKKKAEPSADEDAGLWHHVIKDIDPLPADQQNYFTEKPDISTPVSKIDPQKTRPRPVPRSRLPAGLCQKTTPKQTNPPMEHGHAPGLDSTSKRRMRRGKLNIDATIDLHGMTKAKAHPALVKFIETAFQRGHQTILVITGKGLKNDGTVGVLRKSVPDWLNQPALAPWIKGFSYAAPKHGGVGALYVMLRRKK